MKLSVEQHETAGNRRRSVEAIRRAGMRLLLALTRHVRVRGRLRLANALNPLLMPAGGYIVSEVARGILMELDLTDEMQRKMHYLGDYEPREIAFILKTLPRGGVFVDIGANVGWHTLPAARQVGDAGTVYSFEPLSPNVERLRRNLALNRLTNVVMETAALSDRDGEAEMASDHPRSGNATMAHRDSSAQRFRVPTMRFDQYARQHRLERVDLIKIDIEGAEMMALRGMTDLLQKRPAPPILCEINPTMLSLLNSSAQELLEFLARFGYEPFALGGHGEARPVRNLPGAEEHENFVFMQAGRGSP